MTKTSKRHGQDLINSRWMTFEARFEARLGLMSRLHLVLRARGAGHIHLSLPSLWMECEEWPGG